MLVFGPILLDALGTDLEKVVVVNNIEIIEATIASDSAQSDFMVLSQGLLCWGTGNSISDLSITEYFWTFDANFQSLSSIGVNYIVRTLQQC